MLDVGGLKDVLNYDGNTGVFTWKKDIGRKTKAGSIAGSVDSGYRTIKINGVKYKAHRLAWLYVYGQWPENLIDHVDRDGLNNAINNLREATRQENNRNKSTYSNNTSGFKGVIWDKATGRWRVRIRVSGKLLHIGYYLELEDASSAAAQSRENHHAEFYSD